MHFHRPWIQLAAVCALIAVNPPKAEAGGGWLGVAQKGSVYHEPAQKCEREKCEPEQRDRCRGHCGRGCGHCNAPPQGMVVSSMPVMAMAPMMMAPVGMVSAAPVAAAPAAAPTSAVAAPPQWTWSQAAQPQQNPASMGDYNGLLELCRALNELSKSAAPAAAPSRAPEGSLEDRVSKLERDVQELQGTVNLHSRAIQALLKKSEGE